jgi:transposase-like protein
VDFLLSEHRDIAAARLFFTQAIEKQGAPEKITLDGYAATHSGSRVERISDLANRGMRANKQVLEQPHGARSPNTEAAGISMLGFRRFDNASITISGIGFAHKIKKGQFDTSSLALSMKVADRDASGPLLLIAGPL